MSRIQGAQVARGRKAKSKSDNVQKGLFDQPEGQAASKARAEDDGSQTAEAASGRPRLFLIDASGFIFRAYYALPPLSNSQGVPTGASYGFAQMVLKFLRDEQPEYLAVVWDAEGPSFRHEMYEEYKANRDETPEDLIPQFGQIRQLVDAWRLPTVEAKGYEADDVIASLTRKGVAAGLDVVIASSDKDLMQLVSDRVHMVDTMRNRTFGPKEVEEKLGVPPELVADYLAMTGDSSDNVPGIKGVGPKTATALLKEFGSLEAILSRSSEIQRPRWRNLVEEHADMAKLSRELVELADPPVDKDPTDLRVGEGDEPVLRQLFEELEFGRLLKDLKPKVAVSRKGYRGVLTSADLDKAVADLKKAPYVAFDTETTSLDPMVARLVGVSLCGSAKTAYYIPVGHTCEGAPEQLGVDEVLSALRPLLASADVRKVAQNAKYDVQVLRRHGLEVVGHIDEPLLASYVLNPTRTSHGLDALALEFLGHTMISYTDVAGKGASQVTFDQVSVDKAIEYSAEDAHVTFLLWEQLSERLQQVPSLAKVYDELEIPLVPLLMGMEGRGIRVDASKLEKLSKEYESTLADLEVEIYKEAGEEFNIASTPQLREILFKKLGLPVVRRTKSGPSTDRSVLETLAPEHPVPNLILRYRELAKLKSTYVDALPNLINAETGRIHTSWNQTVAATGRLSSSDPNLQNIPIRTDEGKKIREAFVAEEGCSFLAADYSQMELRILAHMSADPILVDAFKKGEDVHARTAQEVFGEVNPDLRRRAKAINFGIIYGQTPFGLARQLGIERGEAADFIEKYLERYQGVSELMDRTIKEAKRRGYVETMFGRRRPMPDINAANRNVREAAKRAAINAPLQGTAADIMKKAMLCVQDRLDKEGRKACIVLQIHDELVLEVPDAELDDVRTLLVECMEGVADLKVKLSVDVATGATWAEV